jgi:hypothetical protein
MKEGMDSIQDERNPFGGAAVCPFPTFVTKPFADR